MPADISNLALHLISPLVAVGLAVYGWFVITRIAKRRESYDLCSSILGILEQLEREAVDAWQGGVDSLGAYTAGKLAGHTNGMEQRLEFLKDHYHPTGITKEMMMDLRMLATRSARGYMQVMDRLVAMQSLVQEITATLIEDNYNYINGVKV